METIVVAINGQTLEADRETGEVIGERCGCYACSEGAQPGHPYCYGSSDRMLALEAAEKAWRSLDDSAWRWYVNV